MSWIQKTPNGRWKARYRTPSEYTCIVDGRNGLAVDQRLDCVGALHDEARET